MVCEHGAVDNIGQVTLEAARAVLPGLALGSFALKEGARRSVVARLREGHDVEGAVQPAIAAAIETVALGVAGRGRDGRHPAGHGEGRCRAKASWIAGLSQQASGGDGADAGDRSQRAVVFAEAYINAALKRSDLSGQRFQASEALTGDLRRYSVQGREQLPRPTPIGDARQTTESSKALTVARQEDL